MDADGMRRYVEATADLLDLPVTPEQVRGALGDSVIEQAVAVTGIPADKLLVLMAGYLPNAVDAMSPNGSIEGTPPA